MDASQANLFQQLAGRIIYADAASRPASDTIQRGAGGPQGLWAQGISGDLPIVLLRIEDAEDLVIARQLLQAHEYLGIKRLSVDFVILNERGSSYIQDLQVALEALVRMSQARPRIAGADTRGKVFVLRSDLITGETRALLLATARVVFSGRRGALADQMARMQPVPVQAPRAPRRAPHAVPATGLRSIDRKRRASSNSSTASADSPPAAANTPCWRRAARRRRHRGSTSSRTRASDSMSRPMAPAAPGRATAAKTR